MYGSEIWGAGNNEIIERVQLKYYKHLLNLKKSTPSIMIYGELGIYPIQVDIHTKMVSFWTKLVKPDNFKLSSIMYAMLMSLQTHSNNDYQWLKCLKQIFVDCGVPGIWAAQNTDRPKWLINSMNLKLKDLYLQKWRESVNNDTNYRLFKDTIILEKYMLILSTSEFKSILAYRTRNHKLPIETGRWLKRERCLRLCTLCHSEMGDEFHYLFNCKQLKHARQLYIKPYYRKSPNVIKYQQLLSTHNNKDLKNLAKFVALIMKYFSN